MWGSALGYSQKKVGSSLCPEPWGASSKKWLRTGWSYLICPVGRWQFSSWVAEEVEHRSMPWPGNVQLKYKGEATKEEQPPSITMGSPCLPALTSWPSLTQFSVYPSRVGCVTNPWHSTCCEMATRSPGLMPGAGDCLLWRDHNISRAGASLWHS